MIQGIRLIRHKTSLKFVGLRRIFFAISLAAIVASAGLYLTRGLNLGIDFLGGILIEVQTSEPADIGRMRRVLGNIGLGEVALQEFGAADDVLIRVARQPGGEKAQLAAVATVKQALADMGQGEMSYRRVEFVGPKVSAELVEAGTIAVLSAVVLML